MRSESYQRFQSSLLPTIDPQTIIGVKIPDLRKLAKSLAQADTFLSDLPHRYFEENIIHSILLSSMCDFYQVPIFYYGTKEELGHAMGKEMRASLAITDAGFAKSLTKLLEE